MTYSIPTSLDEITVEQYIKYQEIINIPDLDSRALAIGTIAVFCNLSTDEVKLIPYKEFKETLEQIDKTLNSEAVFIPIYENLGFIPNLDEISAGEYIDLDTYSVEYKDYHRFLAVCYRPITKKGIAGYLIEEYKGTDETANDMLKKPLSLLLGAQVFFWNLKKDLFSSILQSLKNPLTKQQSEADLETNGDGIRQYMLLLEETLKIMNGQRSRISTSF